MFTKGAPDKEINSRLTFCKGCGDGLPRQALSQRRPAGRNRPIDYLIATALGGEAIPPTRCSGTETSMNS